MAEYKGIYYGDDHEQQFYEGGAHFSYTALYSALEILAEIQMKKTLKISRKMQPKTRNYVDLEKTRTGNKELRQFNTIGEGCKGKFYVSKSRNKNKKINDCFDFYQEKDELNESNDFENDNSDVERDKIASKTIDKIKNNNKVEYYQKDNKIIKGRNSTNNNIGIGYLTQIINKLGTMPEKSNIIYEKANSKNRVSNNKNYLLNNSKPSVKNPLSRNMNGAFMISNKAKTNNLSNYGNYLNQRPNPKFNTKLTNSKISNKKLKNGYTTNPHLKSIMKSINKTNPKIQSKNVINKMREEVKSSKRNRNNNIYGNNNVNYLTNNNPNIGVNCLIYECKNFYINSSQNCNTTQPNPSNNQNHQKNFFLFFVYFFLHFHFHHRQSLINHLIAF